MGYWWSPCTQSVSAPLVIGYVYMKSKVVVMVTGAFGAVTILTGRATPADSQENTRGLCPEAVLGTTKTAHRVSVGLLHY